MSETLSEIVRAAEQAVAGGEADKIRLARLLDGIDLAVIDGPEGRAYLAVLLDWLGMREQAALALRPVGGREGPGTATPNLAGVLAAGHGEYEQARELFMRALSATTGSTLLRAKILVNLATLSLLADDVESAAGWLALASDASGQFGDPATDVLLASAEFGIARARGDLPGQRETVSRLNKATRARVAELGPNHPLAVSAVASLAAADFELAAAERSVENQQRAITVLEITAHRLAADLGADHPQALASLEDLCVADLHLALASESMDRASRAARTLESVSQRMTAAVGEGHPQAREAAVNAASARRVLELALAGNDESHSPELTPAGEGTPVTKRRHRVVSGAPATTAYATAKVLVLGDSGVGKSGLARVLAGQEFQATDSTHGRRIWRVPTEEPNPPGDTREVLLWDLAGQPGYRIVHQLHLEGAALALILFDAKSETEPLAGVRYWAHAVRHAHPAEAGGLTTFLVAARADRGGSNVSDQRIHRLMDDFSIDGYVKTSAKEGTNVDLLRSRLLRAIDWARIPQVTSTTLFALVKQFVVDQASSGSLLTPLDELCRTFQEAVPSDLELMTDHERADDDEQRISPDRLTSVFEGCIAHLESKGQVKRLKFGNYVLLHPELLDAYASAIVNAARDEPDGLGSISETRAITVDFPVPSSERVPEERQERLLMLATLEELLQHELVLREPTEDGVQLVFPSASRRDLPASEIPVGDGVIFRFDGPIQNIYATLIVRLARSNRFRRVDSWQSAARFAVANAEDDLGLCTVAVRSDREGEGELLIGYDLVSDDVRKQFERFVAAHLHRRATPGSVTRERRYTCPDDGIAFTPEQVHGATRLGRLGLLCPVCKTWVPLLDYYYDVDAADQDTAAMDAAADASREIAAASAVLRAKEEVAEYDVFLSYNWRDKEAVRLIARQLRERGLRPWLDERELRPGLPWQVKLDEVIAGIPAVAVIIGARLGPWQNTEMRAFVQHSVTRGCAVVPVLLPGANTADLPVFLRGLTWVNLAVPEPDPIDQLVWGITGIQPNT